MINHYPKLILFLTVAFILFFSFFSGAEAGSQVGLSISPQKFDLIIFPGDIYQGQIKLTNRSSFPLPVSIRAVPFGAEQGSGQMTLVRPDPDSPSFWFDFETREMLLDAGQMKRINFEISVPPDAPAGGYYVFVYFEPRIPSTYFEDMGPKTIPVIGLPFLISTTPLLLEPEQGPEMSLLDFLIPAEQRAGMMEEIFSLFSRQLAAIGVVQAAQSEVIISRQTPSSFILRIKNNDIYHLRPRGNLYLYNALGGEIGRAELEGQTILPGRSRDFEVFLSQPETNLGTRILNFLSLGRYRAELDLRAVSPMRGEIILAGQQPVMNFFSIKIFYFFIIFAIMMLLFYLIRKRIKLALKEIISPGKKQ